MIYEFFRGLYIYKFEFKQRMTVWVCVIYKKKPCGCVNIFSIGNNGYSMCENEIMLNLVVKSLPQILWSYFSIALREH